MLTVLMLVIVTGCRPSVDRQRLELADNLVQEAPYTARLQLDSIDTIALKSAKDRALYSLLSIETKYSIEKVLADTSLIAGVRNYFAKNPEKDYRIRANYFYAFSQYRDSCLEQAVVPAVEAFLEARNSDYRFWLANTARMLSLILSSSQHPERALELDTIACSNFRHVERKWDYFYSKIMMAKNLTSVYQAIRADSLLVKTGKEIEAELPSERGLIIDILLARLRIKILEKDYSGVSAIRADLNEIKNSHKFRSSDYSYLAIIETGYGNYESACKYLDSASNILKTYYDADMYERAKLIYARSINDREMESMSASRLLVMMRNFDRNVTNSRTVVILDELFAKNARESEKMKRNSLKKCIYFAIAFLAVAFVVIFILRKCYRRKSQELIMKDKELASSEEKVVENEKEIARIKTELLQVKASLGKTSDLNSELKETISEVYRQDMPVLSKLYDSFSDFGGCAANDLYRSERLKMDLSSFFAKKDLEWFVSVADLANDGLLSELKREIPYIKRTYLELFALYLSGFTTKGIAVMLGVSRNAVDQRKSRLRILIESSESIIDKEKFLKFLDASNRH